MCEPFSCIVTSDLTVIAGVTVAMHSRTAILRFAGLPTERTENQYALAELKPPNWDYDSDPAGWKLVLDQHRTPDWWVENLPEIDSRVRDAARRWQGQLRRLTTYTVEDGDNLYLPSGFSGQISMRGGAARFCGQSTGGVATQHGGQVWFYDQSSGGVTEQHGGQVWFCDQSSGGNDDYYGGVVYFGPQTTGWIKRAHAPVQWVAGSRIAMKGGA